MDVAFRCARQVRRTPVAHADQDYDADGCGYCEPGNTALAVRQHDKRRKQRTEGGARVAAHLKERLRKAMLAAGCDARNARRFRMKDRRSCSNDGRSQQQQAECWRQRQHQNSRERKAHSHCERIRHGPLVGVEPDQRLQKTCHHLVGERQQSDLAEVQMKGALENGIDRRQQRLHHVIDEMADADRGQDAQDETRSSRSRALKRIGSCGFGRNRRSC